MIPHVKDMGFLFADNSFNYQPMGELGDGGQMVELHVYFFQ